MPNITGTVRIFASWWRKMRFKGFKQQFTIMILVGLACLARFIYAGVTRAARGGGNRTVLPV
jgi:hypothetical protein